MRPSWWTSQAPDVDLILATTANGTASQPATELLMERCERRGPRFEHSSLTRRVANGPPTTTCAGFLRCAQRALCPACCRLSRNCSRVGSYFPTWEFGVNWTGSSRIGVRLQERRRSAHRSVNWRSGELAMLPGRLTTKASFDAPTRRR